MALYSREILFEKYFFVIARFLKYSLALKKVYKAGIEKVP